MGTAIRGPLTEPMFYTLMAFRRRPMCGTEVADFIRQKTNGRVTLGPGTLYTILAKFLDQGILVETMVEGRRRTYQLTVRGQTLYDEELARLRACVQDASDEELAGF